MAKLPERGAVQKLRKKFKERKAACMSKCKYCDNKGYVIYEFPRDKGNYWWEYCEVYHSALILSKANEEVNRLNKLNVPKDSAEKSVGDVPEPLICEYRNLVVNEETADEDMNRMALEGWRVVNVRPNRYKYVVNVTFERIKK